MKIVETIINCNSGASSILSSKQIGFSNHDQNKNHNNYANPVINASKDGNFYSWSSQYGIISSFKKPQDYDFSTFGFDTIGVNNVGEGCSTMDFQHPSLNPYSIMFNANSVKNENQASLVFQGSNCLYEDNSYIYFSRLKLDSNNKVYHYQVDNNSTNYQYPKGSAFFFLDSGRTVRFHWGAKQGKFPSVYRSLKSTLFRYESIAWERRYATTNSQVFALNIMDINQFNSSNLSTWNITSIAHLSPAEGLGNDDAGKPVFGNPKEVDRSNYFNPELRGNTIMNFTWGNKIYHIPLDYNSTITDTSFVDEAKALRSIKYVANGKLPHLMNGPIQLPDSSVWQNRRIYNTLDTHAKITSSARYYYFKKNEAGDEINSSYGFANDTTFLMMTKAKLNDYDLQIKLPLSMIDSVLTYNNSDTIYSNWFNVGSSAQLSFVYKGSDMTKNACYIQRADTNLKYYLTLTQTNDTIYNLVNYNMINGNNHDYRLVIQRLDSNSRYNEEILLGDLHYNDTLFFKSNNRFDSKTIDLATYKETFSKIYPNPNDGKINLLLAIDYDRDNKIILLISDITGQVIKEFTTDYKDQIKLDMSNVTNGSYILQIKGYKHDKPTTETLQFKINK